MDPRILIAGGGVAALEALLALHRQLAGEVQLTLLAPEPDFVYRPLAVAMPFGAGPVPTLPLAEVANEHGAKLLLDALVGVDADERIVTTHGGDRIEYDELVLAIGARPQPVAPGTIRFGEPGDAAAVRDVVLGVRRGAVRRVALSATGGTSWTLPLYELALELAGERTPAGTPPEVFVVTPEGAPLESFGAAISAGASVVLDEHGVRVLTASTVESYEDGLLWIDLEGALAVDAAIALPHLRGPAVPGIAHDRHGFVPVDRHGQVDGAEHVYAAGDMCAHPVKQGGLAAQQADAVAAHIAWRLGAADVPATKDPVLRAVLLTGDEPRFLHSGLTGADGGGISREPQWWPPAKIAARHLAPYLADRQMWTY
jgi:sulfide:quinone oxidoreductase